VDAAYVVKVFRKLQSGVHPEIEIGRFLLDAGYQNTPTLLGSVDLIENGERTALAVAHRFVENQGDAWTVTGNYLDRFADEQSILAPAEAAESPEVANYLQYVRQIGRRTAELHQALASRDDLPDFAPKPITSDDVERWTARLLQNVSTTLDHLAEARPTLPEGSRELAERFVNHRQRVAEYVGTLLLRHIDAHNIRHHGDFHLGQLLVAKDDVYILDFEGEPNRALAERRRRAPAARDIAGLIRSIDYSTIAALTRAAAAALDRERLAKKLEEWRDRTAQCFLAAYREFLIDPRLWPQHEEDAQRLLDFFLIEKAFYEVGYELANRPTWLQVPLAGLERLLSQRGVLGP
jgi:maltose alpha-D-glucosyltransferase/alpha-amylase